MGPYGRAVRQRRGIERGRRWRARCHGAGPAPSHRGADLMRAIAVIVFVSCVSVAFAQTRPVAPPLAVAEGKDDKLVYATDAQGNRVIDFATCGYLGGDAQIPNVPVRVVVPHKDGDATAHIQAAIDHVASLPEAQRGAVLLTKGRFEVG